MCANNLALSWEALASGTVGGSCKQQLPSIKNLEIRNAHVRPAIPPARSWNVPCSDWNRMFPEQSPNCITCVLKLVFPQSDRLASTKTNWCFLNRIGKRPTSKSNQITLSLDKQARWMSFWIRKAVFLHVNVDGLLMLLDAHCSPTALLYSETSSGRCQTFTGSHFRRHRRFILKLLLPGTLLFLELIVSLNGIAYCQRNPVHMCLIELSEDGTAVCQIWSLNNWMLTSVAMLLFRTISGFAFRC